MKKLLIKQHFAFNFLQNNQSSLLQSNYPLIFVTFSGHSGRVLSQLSLVESSRLPQCSQCPDLSRSLLRLKEPNLVNKVHEETLQYSYESTFLLHGTEQQHSPDYWSYLGKVKR